MQQIGHPLYPRGEIPTIMVRMEDGLFNPRKMVDTLCDCVGGIKRKNLYLRSGKSKKHGSAKTRQQVLDTYSDPMYRIDHYTQQDLQFMRRELNQDLIKLFEYEF